MLNGDNQSTRLLMFQRWKPQQFCFAKGYQIHRVLNFNSTRSPTTPVSCVLLFHYLLFSKKKLNWIYFHSNQLKYFKNSNHHRLLCISKCRDDIHNLTSLPRLSNEVLPYLKLTNDVSHSYPRIYQQHDTLFAWLWMSVTVLNLASWIRIGNILYWYVIFLYSSDS